MSLMLAMMNHLHFKKEKDGFAVLYAVLVASVVAIGGLILSNIIFKQLVLSGVGQSSQISYYAADVGRACARYWESQTSFGTVITDFDEVGNPLTPVFYPPIDQVEINCLGGDSVIVAEPVIDTENPESSKWRFKIEDINNNSCAEVTIVNNIEEFQSTSVGYNNKGCTSNNRLVLRRVQDLVSRPGS
jgi:hypothetical protein